GMALMGTGVSDGENRAVEAAQKAISSPLLEDCSIEGARGVLINITGGRDMTLFEVSEAATIIQKAAAEEAEIIFGTVIDNQMDTNVKITVIATGFNREEEALRPGDPFSQQEPVSAAIDHDTPSYKRSRRLFDLGGLDEKNPSGGGYTENAGSSHINEDLDVPTFLRRQMD
ncbi:MAG: cell division protein FtsZ, partial [Acidobacteriota bacterium]